MTKFKPGDKVLIHMRDENSKRPVAERFGIIATYELYTAGKKFPHRVRFDGEEHDYCDEEIQLLEDE